MPLTRTLSLSVLSDLLGLSAQDSARLMLAEPNAIEEMNPDVHMDIRTVAVETTTQGTSRQQEADGWPGADNLPDEVGFPGDDNLPDAGVSHELVQAPVIQVMAGSTNDVGIPVVSLPADIPRSHEGEPKQNAETPVELSQHGLAVELQKDLPDVAERSLEVKAAENADLDRPDGKPCCCLLVSFISIWPLLTDFRFRLS